VDHTVAQMTLRIGFLGAGFIAELHSKMLDGTGTPFVRAGVYDPDTARAERFAEASGTPLRASEEEVIESSDAVYVCTWTSEHARLVEASAARGVAVFCEKPLARDLNEAAGMARVVAEAGVVNQVGLILRFSPAFCWLRHLVSDPASGRVMNVVYRDDQYLPVQGMYGSTWRADRTKAGSGTLLEHSIHDIDLIEWIAGPVARLSARSSSFHGIEGIEDSVAISFSLAGGGVGTLASVWHDMLERPGSRHVEVICERLWCELDGNDWFGPVRWVRAGEVARCLEGGELADRVWKTGLAAVNPDAEFLAAAEEGRPAAPDFTAALRAHAVVDAAYRSAEKDGSPVTVEPPR
jgi:predicted dehydrogenase